MARLEEEEVYDLLNRDWITGKELYDRISKERGFEKLSFFDFTKRILSFQLPYVNKIQFYICIANLRAQEAIEIRRERDEEDIMNSQIRRSIHQRNIDENEFITPYAFWFFR